jgi:hypothetical protein
MAAAPTPTPQSARAALGALERYQLHITQLAGNWLDMDLYHTVAVDLEQVRRSCATLPQLSGSWVTLLIAHAELMHALWRGSRPGTAASAQERQQLLARTRAACGRLQDVCMQLLRAAGQAG